MDVGNIVVVQGKSGGVEYGKYIIPLPSSHLPLGRDLILGPTKCQIEGSGGPGAEVYDYWKGRLLGAADGSQPFRSETNLMPSVPGSRR